jgi:hypothetical protein
MGPLWSVILVCAVAGCYGNSHRAPDVAGHYRATELRLTRGGKEVDLLGQGVRLWITLEPDDSSQGKTRGSVVLPAAYTESGKIESHSLLGRYTYDPAAGSVAFEHDSESFLPYLTWQVDGTQLRASFSAGSDWLKVSLQREG